MKKVLFISILSIFISSSNVIKAAKLKKLGQECTKDSDCQKNLECRNKKCLHKPKKGVKKPKTSAKTTQAPEHITLIPVSTSTKKPSASTEKTETQSINKTQDTQGFAGQTENQKLSDQKKNDVTTSKTEGAPAIADETKDQATIEGARPVNPQQLSNEAALSGADNTSEQTTISDKPTEQQAIEPVNKVYKIINHTGTLLFDFNFFKASNGETIDCGFTKVEQGMEIPFTCKEDSEIYGYFTVHNIRRGMKFVPGTDDIIVTLDTIEYKNKKNSSGNPISIQTGEVEHMVKEEIEARNKAQLTSEPRQ